MFLDELRAALGAVKIARYSSGKEYFKVGGKKNTAVRDRRDKSKFAGDGFKREVQKGSVLPFKCNTLKCILRERKEIYRC